MANAQNSIHHAPTVGSQVNAVEVLVHGTVAHGYRASKLLERSIHNAQNDEIGRVHDIVISGSGNTAFAVVGVGGFLGIDEKLVAVPTDEFEIEGADKVLLPEATKKQLEAMPAFHWSE